MACILCIVQASLFVRCLLVAVALAVEGSWIFWLNVVVELVDLKASGGRGLRGLTNQIMVPPKEK